MLFDIARGREPASETLSYLARLRLHGATVLAFLIGGVIGVFVYEAIGSVMLIAAAVLLLAIALTGILKARGARA
jgi:VIT1/CCC1 family predicted Fe2+/Mn2+ transporter